MESGFEDDFAPMQSSAGKPATIDDDSLILGDEDDSPKKTSEGKMKLVAKAFTSLQQCHLQTITQKTSECLQIANKYYFFLQIKNRKSKKKHLSLESTL